MARRRPRAHPLSAPTYAVLAAAARPASGKAIAAWALYDLANTFFAVTMVSFYFPLWLVEDRGAKELWFSLALAVSMALAAVLMPPCGAFSDVTGQRVRPLRWTTYGCVAAVALIALTDRIDVALALFVLANLCYQLGTIFYDALLWDIAPAGRLGATSGLGAAFGYLGSMAGLGLLWPIVSRWGHRASFVPSAALFLLFALPLFFLVRQPRPPAQASWRAVWGEAGHRLRHSVAWARTVPGVWRFLWASFFSANAISTVLTFMAVYTKRVAGFSEAEVIRFFLFGQAFAVLGALAGRWIIPRWGARRALAVIWTGWVAGLGLIAGRVDIRWLWIAGPVIGFCLGPTWATSRVMLIELAPKERLGELLGLAGVVARASSILGPILWGLLVWDPARSTHAVLAMMVLLLIGILLLQRVPNPAKAAG